MSKKAERDKFGTHLSRQVLGDTGRIRLLKCRNGKGIWENAEFFRNFLIYFFHLV